MVFYHMDKYVSNEYVKKHFDYWPERVERPELAPCPLCGGWALSWFDFVDLDDDPGGGNGFFVGCPDCTVVFASLWTPDDAAERYNLWAEGKELEEIARITSYSP